MTRFAGLSRRPWPILLAVSIGGLTVSAALTQSATLPGFCGDNAALLMLASDPQSMLALLMAFNSPARLALEWILMLLAMMPLLLAVPLMHVWRSSVRQRRGRAIALFCAAYVAVWAAAAPGLLLVSLMLQFLAGSGGAFLGAVILALIWSASPIHRLALNRGHRLRRIGVFGLRADRDCIAFGMRHAVWCVLSCWGWMIVPLTAGAWHLPAMVAVSAILFAERVTPNARPRWKTPTTLSALIRMTSRLGKSRRPHHA